MKRKAEEQKARKAEWDSMSESERRVDAFMKGYDKGYQAGRLEQSMLDARYMPPVIFGKQKEKKK